MPGQEDIADRLAQLALFADLSGPQREKVAHTLDEAWFSEGERVLRQGFSGSGLYFILEGTAAIRIDGVERTTLNSGDYFGEISVLLGDPPVADIVAVRPLHCLVLPSANVETFLKSHPSVMYRLLQGEARKLRTTTKWLS
jgi:CRP/FNR family cyclic AMP-dependent transcriptional regulator